MKNQRGNGVLSCFEISGPKIVHVGIKILVKMALWIGQNNNENHNTRELLFSRQWPLSFEPIITGKILRTSTSASSIWQGIKIGEYIYTQ